MNTAEAPVLEEVPPRVEVEAIAEVPVAVGEVAETVEEAREFSLMRAMNARWESGQRAGWSPAELEAREAWLERLKIQEDRPSASAGRSAQLAWDKRQFFNNRRWRAALEALDVEDLERRRSEPTATGEDDAVLAGTAGPEGAPETASRPVDVASRPEPPVEVEAPALAQQVEDAASFGLVLPEAEVVVDGQGSRGGGLRLRALDREAMERRILEHQVRRRLLDLGQPRAQAGQRRLVLLEHADQHRGAPPGSCECEKDATGQSL